ncbi:hypothetical protein H8356DRAFT_1336213 [Neocallimastix lanati (nom. inval.)]|nr:hypothetical protein H8356DRAFT_1336213 [Neocallimastix sp. JGI-2020a]
MENSGNLKQASNLSFKCIRLSIDSLLYRNVQYERPSLHTSLYDGLLLSNLLNHHRGWKSSHINSRGSCGVDPETLHVLLPGTNHQDKNWKDYYL